MSKCGKDKEQKKSTREKERRRLVDKFGFIRPAVIISIALISSRYFSTTNFYVKLIYGSHRYICRHRWPC